MLEEVRGVRERRVSWYKDSSDIPECTVKSSCQFFVSSPHRLGNGRKFGRCGNELTGLGSKLDIFKSGGNNIRQAPQCALNLTN